MTIQITAETIANYLSEKQFAWSETTQRSEAARLQYFTSHPIGTPKEVYVKLTQNGYKPYSIQTAWTRLVSFLDWQNPAAASEFRQFRKTNRRAFQNAYIPITLDVSYDEAKRRIETITNAKIRESAIALLESGLRIHELYKVDRGEQTVTGKGGTKRAVFVPLVSIPASPREIRQELKQLGLTPHMLRKLFATRLVEAGASDADLLQIMGWKSILTARSYLQPKQKDAMHRLVEKARGMS